MRTAAFAGLMACALMTAPAFAADNEGASLKLKAPTTITADATLAVIEPAVARPTLRAMLSQPLCHAA